MVPFRTLNKELFPNKSIFVGEVIGVAETKDSSNSPIVFFNVWTVVATMSESFINGHLSELVLLQVCRLREVRHLVSM